MQSQLAALARAGIGAIALDRHGRHLEANEAAPLGDGLEVVAGAPQASHRSDQAALEAAIRLALLPERPSQKPAPPRVALRRPSGRRPLLVQVLPLIGRPQLSLLRAAALLLVTDPDRPAQLPLADLQTVFGLTRREAELAARLADGASLEEAAGALAISREHARQRLKAVFRKTDTHRQAELVALLARLWRPLA